MESLKGGDGKGDRMRFIKSAIKRTFLYDIIRSVKLRKSMRRWTEHDQKVLEFYSQFIKPGDLCFDIGANMGNRTKIFLKLSTTVVAVEPQDECMKVLQKFYSGNERLKLVKKALGEVEGQVEMMISNEHAISSMSKEWIEEVKKSGRFSEFTWNKKQMVTITTIDKLIDQYGIPSFIKIDVEGYEYQVIRGLTRPIHTLSVEFIPEFIESTFRCINYLSTLGDIQLNYSLGESMMLAFQDWVTPQQMVGTLSGYRNDRLFGDVYVRFSI